MNAETKIEAGPLAKLREPFPPKLISKLPKETKAQTEARKNNREGINCTICGGWHHPRAVHLDYVGHAALTDRLLDVDPHWTWEPVGFDPNTGLPALQGGLWIKLTVCGVTRYGFGAADGKSGGDAIKEMIGDALRNAAMRFGAALDLWHKGDLHAEDEDAPVAAKPALKADPAPVKMASDEQRDTIQTVASAANKPVKDICAAYAKSTGREIASLKDLTAAEADAVIARLQKLTKEPANA